MDRLVVARARRRRLGAWPGMLLMVGFLIFGVGSAGAASGMDMFNSGPLNAVTYFSHAFTAAGSYPYQSTTDTGMAGTIDVPVLAPTEGRSDTPFTVTWSTAPPTGNTTFDVQVELPGTTSYVPWQTAVAATHAPYTPSAGPGTYRFQARRTDNGGASGWSPPVSVSVS